MTTLQECDQLMGENGPDTARLYSIIGLLQADTPFKKASSLYSLLVKGLNISLNVRRRMTNTQVSEIHWTTPSMRNAHNEIYRSIKKKIEKTDNCSSIIL